MPTTFSYTRNVAPAVISYYFFLSAWAGGIQQILQSDWFRERAKFSHLFPLSASGIIKNVWSLSGNLLSDLCLLNDLFSSFGETSFFNLDYLCFHYYLLARNCSVCRESCHDYSPKMFGSFARLSLCCRKKQKCVFTSLGRSVLGKTVPSVLSTTRGLRPRAVSKTSGTVFPNTDLPAGE